jgi:hypothetical protein
MCHTHGPIPQQIQDVCFLGESLQIAMAVFDVVVFVMQIKYFNVYISKLKYIQLILQIRRQ